MEQPPFEQSMPMPGGAGPQTQPMSSPQAMGTAGPSKGARNRDVPKEQLNAALEVAAQVVGQALYSDTSIADGLMQMLDEGDKVGSTAKAVVTLLFEVNKRDKIPERIMPALAIVTADEMMDMAEEAGVMQYSSKEAEQVALTTAEILLEAYGVDPERAQQMASQVSQSELQQAENSLNTVMEGGKNA